MGGKNQTREGKGAAYIYRMKGRVKKKLVFILSSTYLLAHSKAPVLRVHITHGPISLIFKTSNCVRAMIVNIWQDINCIVC